MAVAMFAPHSVAQAPRVALVINATLAPKLEPDITRLAQDLRVDGYTPFVKLWTPKAGGDGKRVWQLLKKEYNSAAGLRGAILIGDIPVPTIKVRGGRAVNSDLLYWIMSAWTPTSPTRPNIWVSRLWGTSSRKERLYIGHEVTLLKRALQANHDYRTGASRLPHTAYHYSYGVHKSLFQNERTALEVWPEAFVPTTPLDAYIYGGEFLHVQSHGSDGGYDEGVTLTTLAESLAQIRVAALSLTHGMGSPGALGHQSLFTRGGGNVLNFGAGAFGGITHSFLSVAMLGPQQAPFRANLKKGMTWGDALLHSYVLPDPGIMFMGDLSLRPMPFPSNKMPKVSRFRASTRAGTAPLSVDFEVDAKDADGQIVAYDWFLDGHGHGKVSPSVSSKTYDRPIRHVYHAPRRYAPRVEVMDNYKARAFKQREIAVAPAPGMPIRINAGRYPAFQSVDWDDHESYKPGLDVIGKDGRVWMHDQRHLRGTWGWSERYRFQLTPGHQDIAETDDDELFRSHTIGDAKRDKDIAYRIPLPAGKYQVNLGFIELTAKVDPGARAMDIVLEGTVRASAFDIISEAGAALKPVIKRFDVAVDDGELSVRIAAAGASTLNPYVSYIEVLPEGFANAAPQAAIDIAATQRDGEVTFNARADDADGDALRFAWDFDDGHTATSASPTHRFSERRDHLVTLTVFDDRGSAGQATARIRLNESGAVALK